MRRLDCFVLALLTAFPVASVSALDTSVAYVNGDASRALLGDGTGVVVGIIDSGVDHMHPALAGIDSLGNSRLVAQANFVPTEPGSTGDDLFGHGTEVASVVLGADPSNLFSGLATDARYVNARVLDVDNLFDTTDWVRNGVGFAVDHGAQILNLSLNTFAPRNTGRIDRLDFMLDWLAEHRGVIATVSAGNIDQAQNNDPSVRSPAGAFNLISVGRTDSGFSRIHSDSAIGLTGDGRSKPELSAPGTSIRMANADWENGGLWRTDSGTSFASPHAAGLLAQQIDFGMANGYDTSPLVTKATLLNSAQKNVLDKDGNAWEPSASGFPNGVYTVTLPLDNHSGAGQLDGVALYEQYAPGEQGPGVVDGQAWDLGSVGADTPVDYVIGADVAAGVRFTATLTWLRHIQRFDRGAVGLDAADTFSSVSIDDLDLQVFRDGILIAESVSTVDTVEHLSFITDAQGRYTVRVLGTELFDGVNEVYGLAWSTTTVAESGNAADLDRDGDVDDADFGLLFAQFTGPGNGPPANELADQDGDGDVDDADFGLAFAAFTGPNPVATVPQPASMSMLLAGTPLVMRRRRG